MGYIENVQFSWMVPKLDRDETVDVLSRMKIMINGEKIEIGEDIASMVQSKTAGYLSYMKTVASAVLRSSMSGVTLRDSR